MVIKHRLVVAEQLLSAERAFTTYFENYLQRDQALRKEYIRILDTEGDAKAVMWKLEARLASYPDIQKHLLALRDKVFDNRECVWLTDDEHRFLQSAYQFFAIRPYVSEKIH